MSAYDMVFIGLYEDNEEEVMKATLELRGLEMNNNDLVMIFIVFPNNKENELAEKLIEKFGGTAAVLHTPITWKKLNNLFIHVENNYAASDKNQHPKENILMRLIDCKSEVVDRNIYEDITKSDSKMNK